MRRRASRAARRRLVRNASAAVVPAVLWLAPAAVTPAAGQQEAPPDTATEESKKPLPLEAARTLRVETDEGSWLSLDVGPDGRTVAFDFLGDLYTVPIEGGDARQITSGMAYDAQPRFSPDGKEILFVSDRSGGENLWTLELATGDTTRITEGEGNQWISPDWTPDGEYAVASKGETRLGVVKLWLGHVEGGSGQVLTKEPEDLKAVGAAPSPDGRYIWFARRNGSWEYNASFPQYQLAVYDRESGETYTRTSRYGSAFRPTLSPDGRWLAYGTRHDEHTGLRIRDLETGEERWLAYPVQRDEQESIADQDVYPGMSFTPDSRELVAYFGGKIWRLPVDGGDPIQVPFRIEVDLPVGPDMYADYQVEDTPTFAVRQVRDAVPSPDGASLAFVALDRLYVMAWPDGRPRRLTDRDVIEAQPAWSPDGRWIAWVSWDENGGHLWKARADGRESPVRLTRRPAIYRQPAWSPAGDRIVALRGPARAFREATGPFAPGAVDDIVWIPAEPRGPDGSPSERVAPTEGRSTPHFTSDPDRIYLSHGSRGLLSIRWDGTDEKEHLKVLGHKRPGADEPDPADLVLMAPRGDRALAQVNDHLYAVTVPWVGETPTVSVADPENAAFPARKLTEIGGQFPAWEADGNLVHWSIGNAHFVYDLERAKAVEDSLATVEEAEEAEQEREEEEAEDEDRAEAGEAEAAEQEREEEEAEEGYEPVERRIRIEAPRDIPRGSLVLRGARVITMAGDSDEPEVIENADLVIRDNRIAAVGGRGAVEVPEEARVIDATGTTIVPGYVDTHAHLRPAWGIHKNQVWQYLANLAYGVTTTRDPQTGTTDVLAYSDRVDAGEMPGPRVYSTGPGVFGDYVEDPIEDLDHARRILRQYSDYYDTKTIKMYMAGNRRQRQWVAIAAKEQGLMPTTEGGLRFQYDLTLAIDGYPGLEHSLPVAPFYEDVTRLMAGTGMAYTPTLLVSYGGPWAENYWYAEHNPHDDEKLRRFTPHSELDAKTRRRNAGWFMREEHVFPEHGEGVREIVEAGGRVGVGSHGQLQGLGYHWELWSMAAGGLSNHDALRAATIMGAEAIGLEGDLGSIQPGKLADLVVLEADPLDDLRATARIRWVMKNGRLYEGATLDEIWPRERPLERGSWLQEEPEDVPGIRR